MHTANMHCHFSLLFDSSYVLLMENGINFFYLLFKIDNNARTQGQNI